MLEIFLRGNKVAYTRLDQLSKLQKIPDDDNDGLVKVFLLPSTKSGAVTNTADCIIAMDSSFDAGLDEVRRFRSSIVEVNKLAPVIRLVAINTIEHLRLCSPPGQDIPLHVYIETLKNLRQQVGIATQDYGSAISRAPTKISKWLRANAEGRLDIPEIPDLPLFEITVHAKPIVNTNANTTAIASSYPSGSEGGDKRKRQDTQSVASLPTENKRMRVNDPEPTGRAPESETALLLHVVGDITHSDFVPANSMPTDLPTQEQIRTDAGNETLGSSAMDTSTDETEDSVRKRVPAAMEVDGGTAHSVAAMELEGSTGQSVTAMEVGGSTDQSAAAETQDEEKAEDIHEDHLMTFPEVLRTNGLDIESLSREELVAALKRQVEEMRQWIASTGRLQNRYGELKKELISARKELKKSHKTQKDAENRKEHMSRELAKARNERAKLDAELKDARESLLAGPPGMVELERSRAEKENLNEKLRTAENKLQVRDREFDFVKDQYHEASTGAKELQEDNTRLKEANSLLERKNADVVVQLRRMQNDSELQARDRQIENLSLQLRERDERIGRLEHERQVNTRTRGSVGMRASSSIRGSPIQSRATSPTTGAGTYGRESSSTHPLRNG